MTDRTLVIAGFLAASARSLQYRTVAARKPPPTKKPRRPAVSPEEEALFHEAIAGATPLSGRDRIPLPPIKTAIIKPDPLPPRIALTIEGGSGAVMARGPGVNRTQVAELRTGKIRVEATLDLHGHTVAEALPMLEKFMLESARLRRRCVLVIHGKGLHSDGVSVLRDAVLGALTGELSGLVHAFSTAAPSDGGAGATAVMVRA